MKVRTLTTFCLMTLVATSSFSQTEEDSLKYNSHFYYNELNFLDNLYSHTGNPISLSKNKVKTMADANFYTKFCKGDYHAINQGDKSRELGVNISGLKNFGRLDVYGHIDYTNGKEYDHRWDNTLFVTHTNPFILGDSIRSNANTEIFRMSAAASYQFSDRFTGALSMFYKTGSFSDQADPRPKTDAMHFEIKPGIEFKLKDTHALGASAIIDIFRSDISHTVVNNLQNYTYFVMKGMGDYKINTTNDLASYPRDYKGLLYGASLQWAFTPQDSKISNLLQVSFTSNKEVSEDGGYSFTFKSGDYYRKDIHFYNRLRIRNNSSLQQNITVSANYVSDYGDWYDQKKVVDPDHGNIASYQILNKSKINESTYLDANLTYQADFLRHQLPSLTLTGKLGFNRTDTKHFSTHSFKQNFNMIHASAGARKHFAIKKCRLSAAALAYYATPLGDATYAGAEPAINEIYTAPQFEYQSAAHVGFKVEANASLPVHLYGYTTWMGLKLRVASSFYQGDSKYSDLLKSTSRTFIDAAYNIRF